MFPRPLTLLRIALGGEALPKPVHALEGGIGERATRVSWRCFTTSWATVAGSLILSLMMQRDPRHHRDIGAEWTKRWGRPPERLGYLPTRSRDQVIHG